MGFLLLKNQQVIKVFRLLSPHQISEAQPLATSKPLSHPCSGAFLLPLLHMKARQFTDLALPLMAMLIGAVVSAFGIHWLWREYTLHALMVTAFSFFSGGLFVPDNLICRLVAVGIGFGLLVGSLLAVSHP